MFETYPTSSSGKHPLFKHTFCRTIFINRDEKGRAHAGRVALRIILAMELLRKGSTPCILRKGKWREWTQKEKLRGAARRHKGYRVLPQRDVRCRRRKISGWQGAKREKDAKGRAPKDDHNGFITRDVTRPNMYSHIRPFLFSHFSIPSRRGL